MIPSDATLSDASLASTGPFDFPSELQTLQQLVALCEKQVSNGQTRLLPGNVAFLSDGRVLCRERSRGDSRYPYGANGFNFWVNASGTMSGNLGLFFLFLPTQNGQEPSITFFTGCRPEGSESYISHSLLPIPFVDEGEARVLNRYTVIGHDATYFVVETPETFGAVRVFLDQSQSELTQIHFSTIVQNRTERSLDIFTSGYMNPFCRHQFVETNEDRWFKKISVESRPTLSGEVWKNQRANCVVLPPFAITTNEDVLRDQSITNYALVRRIASLGENSSNVELGLSLNGDMRSAATRLDTQECTSRLGYLGSTRRSLNTASFLSSGYLERDVPLTIFNDNAIAGDLLRLSLPVESYFRTDYIFSIPDTRDVLELELEQPLGPFVSDRSLQLVREQLQIPGNLSIAVQESCHPDLDAHTFNRFIPFLKKQVAICATLRGYMQPSPNSLMGFRDVLQAVDCHLLDRPDEARRKIQEVLSYVLIDGRCPRQYSLPVNGLPGKVDLREFIDQGVWAISTVYNYLIVTGDFSFLDEQVGYHQLFPEDENVIVPAGQKDSVLEHLLRIMDYLSQHRDTETGLLLALYGDWNDALDGLGTTPDPHRQFGTGVSVMTSLQLFSNCAEILEILAKHTPGKFSDHVCRYSQLRVQLKLGLLKYAVVNHENDRRIVHGWGDKRSYFVGSYQDSDGLARDSLTSNAFWVLSGMLEQEPTLRSDILAAFDRLDSKYGLKTFEPGFAPGAPGVGRIARLPLGTAENGATYIHATTFAIAALFRMGEAQKAWEQIVKILPFASHHHDPSHSPFVMPNSYIDNPQLNLTGQSMNDWQTGSSNALLKLLVRFGFGFQPNMNCLHIAPADWLPFDEFVFNAVARQREVRITYSREGREKRETWLNGELLTTKKFDEGILANTATIPYEDLRSDGPNEIAVKD